MQQQRFTSLSGRARQWLPVEEFEPEVPAFRPSSLTNTKQAAGRGEARLASVGDLLRYKRQLPQSVPR